MSRKTDSVEGRGKARRNRRTPIDGFSRAERERQNEWLFRRHRKTYPAWKRD